MIAPPPELRAPEAPATESIPPAAADQRRGRFGPFWRTVRAPLLVLMVVVLGVFLVVLLAPAAKSNTYLDPAGKDAIGTKALVDILGERGFAVTSVYSPGAAIDAIGSASGAPLATLVITRPDLLTNAERSQLARVNADLFLVEPSAVSLRALAPAIRVAGNVTDGHAAFGPPVAPDCAIAGARLAGPANLGLITYHRPSYAAGCYPIDGYPSVVRYHRAGRTITILGSGLLMSDDLLASQGNAALALNLLNAHRVIVWLTPEPTIPPPPPPPASRGASSGPSLIPGTAWLVVLQLCVALALAAVWRARRFGPLISEQLPVVVRASETVEGHARLYQARRARDRAAQALRDDMLGRMRPALGLAADAPAQAVAASLASRSRLSNDQILAIVYGSAPGTDVDLVRLAADLDELEREVRSQ